MIFVALGSQKFQFNRLLRQIDKLVETGGITDTIFAQTGASDYLPKNYEYRPFLNQKEFDAVLTGSDLILTHGGTGVIFEALRKGKKVIAVPRLAKYGEHVDDHQIQIITQLDKMGFICPCMDPDDLACALMAVRTREYRCWKSNTGVIMDSIREYLVRL